MIFKAPFLSYADVGARATDFLHRYHPSLELPIPIEHIIEFDLDLYIRPFPNMYRMLKQNGWLSQDRSTIFVDEYQQDNYWEKYRFTLAHEVGHYIMHESVYEGPPFESEQQCLEYFRSCDRDEVNWYEKQADWFADQILVPTQTLEERCNDLFDRNRDKLETDKMPLTDFWSFAAEELAGAFQVAPKVVEIRINREGLVHKLTP